MENGRIRYGCEPEWSEVTDPDEANVMSLRRLFALSTATSFTPKINRCRLVSLLCKGSAGLA